MGDWQRTLDAYIAVYNQHNYAQAAHDIGRIYAEGLINGVPDEKEAAKWWLRGADNGSVRCMYMAALIYGGEALPGCGIKPDAQKQVYWMIEASHFGYEAIPCVIEAQKRVFKWYTDGGPHDSAAKDEVRAFEWLRRMALTSNNYDRGNLRELARYYENGIGTAPDLLRAKDLYDLANGPDKDEGEASCWYQGFLREAGADSYLERDKYSDAVSSLLVAAFHWRYMPRAIAARLEALKHEHPVEYAAGYREFIEEMRVNGRPEADVWENLIP